MFGHNRSDITQMCLNDGTVIKKNFYATRYGSFDNSAMPN